jgi:hypothetical protein
VGGTGGEKGLMLIAPAYGAWTLVGDSQTNADCAYGNGIWMTSNRVSFDDGATWKHLMDKSVNGSAREVTYGGGIFMAAGDNGMFYSRDGQSWKPLATAKNYNRVAYGNGIFMAYGRGPVFTWDGKTETSFTEKTYPELSGKPIYDLAFGRGEFYLSSFSALYRLPSGGAQWQLIQGSGARELYNFVVTDELFVNEHWWSTDGKVWNKATPEAVGDMTEVIATPR